MSKIGEPQYWGFISYSRADTDFVRWLHARLESTPLPRHASTGKERRIFVDRAELPAGPDLSETLTGALSRSQSLIVVLTESSAISQAVNAEIQHFAERNGPDRIVGVLAGRLDADIEACKPPAFKLAKPGNPLLADARRRKDWGTAKDQLLAFLADIAFDDLKQRRRRHRQLQMTLGALGAAGIGALATAAFDVSSDNRRIDAYLRDAASAQSYEKVRLLVAAHRAAQRPFRRGRAATEAALQDPMVRLLLAVDVAEISGQPSRVTRDYLEGALSDGTSILELNDPDLRDARRWYRVPRPWADELELPAPLIKSQNVVDLGELLVSDSSETGGLRCEFSAYDKRTGAAVKVPDLPVDPALLAADRMDVNEALASIDAPMPERIGCREMRGRPGTLLAALEHFPASDGYVSGVRRWFAWEVGSAAWRQVPEPEDQGVSLEESFADDDGFEMSVSADGRRVVGVETRTGRKLELPVTGVRGVPPAWIPYRTRVIATSFPLTLSWLSFREPDDIHGRRAKSVVVVSREGDPRPLFETADSERNDSAIEGFWDDRSVVQWKDDEGDFGGRIRIWTLRPFSGPATPLITTDNQRHSVRYLGRGMFRIKSETTGVDGFSVRAKFPAASTTSAELVARFCRFEWWGIQRRAIDRYLAQPSEEPGARPCR